jgi:hypothetical protein
MVKDVKSLNAEKEMEPLVNGEAPLNGSIEAPKTRAFEEIARKAPLVGWRAIGVQGNLLERRRVEFPSSRNIGYVVEVKWKSLDKIWIYVDCLVRGIEVSTLDDVQGIP